MQVELLYHTPDTERAIATAARLCYAPVGAAELMEAMPEAVSYTHLDVYKRQVLERALVGGAGSSQAAAHHERERDARQTHLEEQRLLLGGPERVDGERQVGQHADSLDRGDGVAAQHERGQRARQDERAERD